MNRHHDFATRPRVFLSPPHIGHEELERVQEAFASNWIAPLGPHVDAFETEFASVVGARHAVALSSGTAALHLALILAGVGRGDEVLVSTLTFSASVNPILYLGGIPVFVDSERRSWNLDPDLVEQTLARRAVQGRIPKALIVVHLYGQSADLEPLLATAEKYGVTVIEDAAEALGSSYHGRHPGVFGQSGIFSFNGNKIITTSGGGMLVTDDEHLASHARKLATQARDPAPHYEHSEIGYNYRLSNVLAGIGRGQLQLLEDRVAARRRNFEAYSAALGSLPGLEFQPEADWGRHTRWLTCVLVDPHAFGADREAIRVALEQQDIESRPVWKPMHMQPVFAGFRVVGGDVSEHIFERGLCLPSGSSLSDIDRLRIITSLQQIHDSAHRS
ncbi:MAG TPA: aminotransferase class I/II-fold pyridoxal phosphate-dependent enzyme [Longimicrobiales bacterium]|nr:aminotransferase class I/II-fold pyridoxal phosphate-dependent enzyme [Longimicrobiales bacterium]